MPEWIIVALIVYGVVATYILLGGFLFYWLSEVYDDTRTGGARAILLAPFWPLFLLFLLYQLRHLPRWIADLIETADLRRKP
ncbi:hypothetical protein [Zhihengliuella flava]|uniref:Uncharacterized protein n=1 Tax=Zhihengliuella flava TaxID=1285193 RepID=A0A931D6Z5_9MICC|nr:hypothetical protein [Zhihengliuella flava]MBG6083262.1 hypothetical protein [Zhihengliuella flava]